MGCAYFKKQANAFSGQTPSSLMNSFEASMSSIERHKKWLGFIRQTIWDRISSENECIPLYDALHYHWLRSCWVMCHQAECNAVALASLNGNGWILKDGNLEILWDTPENIQTVRQNVRLLMNGCGCKSGCRTGRCSCKKCTRDCGAGCRCTHCENTQEVTQQEEHELIRVER